MKHPSTLLVCLHSLLALEPHMRQVWHCLVGKVIPICKNVLLVMNTNKCIVNRIWDVSSCLTSCGMGLVRSFSNVIFEPHYFEMKLFHLINTNMKSWLECLLFLYIFQHKTLQVSCTAYDSLTLQLIIQCLHPPHLNRIATWVKLSIRKCKF